MPAALMTCGLCLGRRPKPFTKAEVKSRSAACSGVICVPSSCMTPWEGRMAIHFGRREFIATIGAAAGWPLAARAQQASTSVIGILSSESLGPYAGRLHAFREGLSGSGYVEGSNVALEYRWADSQYDRCQSWQ